MCSEILLIDVSSKHHVPLHEVMNVMTQQTKSRLHNVLQKHMYTLCVRELKSTLQLYIGVSAYFTIKDSISYIWAIPSSIITHTSVSRELVSSNRFDIGQTVSILMLKCWRPSEVFSINFPCRNQAYYTIFK